MPYFSVPQFYNQLAIFNTAFLTKPSLSFNRYVFISWKLPQWFTLLWTEYIIHFLIVLTLKKDIGFPEMWFFKLKLELGEDTLLLGAGGTCIARSGSGWWLRIEIVSVKLSQHCNYILYFPFTIWMNMWKRLVWNSSISASFSLLGLKLITVYSKHPFYVLSPDVNDRSPITEKIMLECLLLATWGSWI